MYEHFREGIGKRGKQLRDAWFARIEEYRKQYPELADELYRMQHRMLPAGWDRDLPEFPADAKGLATRESSGKVLNAHCQEHSLVDRWIGRSRAFYQNPDYA